MKIGDTVKHRDYPEWKKGKVVALDNDKALIRFPHRFDGEVWWAISKLKRLKKKL